MCYSSRNTGDLTSIPAAWGRLTWTEGCMGDRALRGRTWWVRPAPIAIVATVLLISTLLTPLVSLPKAEAQTNDPEISAALERMNLYRGWLGLEPMRIDPALQAAAEAHANYYRLNSSASGMALHYETPGLPGFTGETMQDRVEAQGYDGWANENIGLSGSMLVSLQWFMGTINHRLPIIDPRYTDVGMATIDEDGVQFEIIVFGMPGWQEFSDPEWVIWPADGMTGAQLSFSGEAPNPWPGASFPTGLPITVSYNGPGQFTLDSWKITARGQEVSSFGNIGSGFLTSHAALIAAAAPLEMGTTYRVTVEGAVDGEPVSHSFSFTTQASDGEQQAMPGGAQAPPPEPPQIAAAPPPNPPLPPPPGNDPDSGLPSGLQSATPEVQHLWLNVDGSVAEATSNHTWIYGPDVWATGPEPYVEDTGGMRDVYYFDKARLEMNESGETDDVTSGLLVRDMLAGKVQIGVDTFTETHPANIPLAGDPLKDNPDAPTYASLSGLASLDSDNRAEVLTGESITAVLNQAGEISQNRDLAGITTYGMYDDTLGHNVAQVFVDYFSGLPLDWLTLVGEPLSEPYWVRTMVAGEPEWVLVQAFERRLLTYTPSNSPEWQVEMGNIGQHYFTWRYKLDAPVGDPVG